MDKLNYVAQRDVNPTGSCPDASPRLHISVTSEFQRPAAFPNCKNCSRSQDDQTCSKKKKRDNLHEQLPALRSQLCCQSNSSWLVMKCYVHCLYRSGSSSKSLIELQLSQVHLCQQRLKCLGNPPIHPVCVYIIALLTPLKKSQKLFYFKALKATQFVWTDNEWMNK